MRSVYIVSFECGTRYAIVVADSAEEAKEMCYSPYNYVESVERVSFAHKGVVMLTKGV